MLTVEDVKKIYDDHEKEYHNFITRDRFLQGLTLLMEKSISKTENFGAEHDIFYGPALVDLVDLTEEDVLKLNQLGWYFDNDYECFAKFI